MKRLTAVPEFVPRHKVRDIRSGRRRKPAHDASVPIVVNLQAYAGRNVIRFPRSGPTPAA
ncbi:hypothetical protein [Sphaerisporangium corydalis]|uniref:Transposase n=1 Tax=Sphaerisporangium corydalis TaxID=1441875 RepID=A0ABV9EN19_9ACTN|nr:hypothetical protein [Sphaerisporangium corydalis]